MIDYEKKFEEEQAFRKPNKTEISSWDIEQKLKVFFYQFSKWLVMQLTPKDTEIDELTAENERLAKYSAKAYKRMDEAMSETLVANAKLSALKAKIAGSQTELLLCENNRFRLQWKDLPLHPTMKMVALLDLTEMEDDDD